MDGEESNPILNQLYESPFQIPTAQWKRVAYHICGPEGCFSISSHPTTPKRFLTFRKCFTGG